MRTTLRLALTLALLACPTAQANGEILDEQGRTIAVIAADGRRTEYSYDEQDRVTMERHEDGTERRFWYDEDGNQHEMEPSE